MKRLKQTIAALACAAVTVSVFSVGAKAAPGGAQIKIKAYGLPGVFSQIGKDCDIDAILGALQNGNIFQNPDCDPPYTPPTDRPETPELPELPETPDNGGGEGSESISEFAREVVRLVNQERAAAGLGELTFSSGVQSAAQVRAREQEVKFSHTRPDGTSCFTALTQAGVTYRRAGENIAYGQTSPQAVMRTWMNSSAHRANILGGQFTSIGVGVHQGSDGTLYWTQMFAG